MSFFFFQAEDGIRDRSPSRGLGDVYKRQVYGRGLLFLDAYYLLAETVNNNTWRPITSVMIDIHRGKYAGLEHRYSRISVEEKGIELKNGHDGHSLRLQDVHGLKWIRL